VHNTGLLELDVGAYDAAAGKLERALELAEEVGDRNEVAYALADQVRVDVERGRLDEAGVALEGALRRSVAIGARIILPLALEGGGNLAAARGEDALAVRLWAAATAERRESGFVNMPADERLLDRRMDEVRGRLAADAFAEAWSVGLALGVPAAVEEAMTLVAAPARRRPPRTTPGGRTAVSV
jgi:tetratricopeptide (TPR) repeat protein